MTQHNNPHDTSDTLYKVYFEVPDPELAIELLKKARLSVPLAGAKVEQFTFEIAIKNQHIPEIVWALSSGGIALYQVRRQPVVDNSCYMI